MAVIVASTFVLIPIDIFGAKFLVYNIFTTSIIRYFLNIFCEKRRGGDGEMLYGRNCCLTYLISTSSVQYFPNFYSFVQDEGAWW